MTEKEINDLYAENEIARYQFHRCMEHVCKFKALKETSEERKEFYTKNAEHFNLLWTAAIPLMTYSERATADEEIAEDHMIMSFPAYEAKYTLRLVNMTGKILAACNATIEITIHG